MDAAQLLERMRTPHAYAALAKVLVGRAMSIPLGEALDAVAIVPRALRITKLAAESEALRAEVLRRVADLQAAAEAEPRPARALVPPALLPPLERAVATPWTPSERLVVRVLDQQPIRDLTAEVLTESLRSFAERLRAAERGLTGGLAGGLADRVTRRGGLFGSLAQGVGAAATGIVGAVKDELEAAMEGRIQAFVASATEATVRRIAAWVADPAQASKAATVRVGAMNTLLDTPTAELAAELRQLDTAALVDAARAAVSAWVDRPETEAELTSLLASLTERAGHLNLGEALADIGMADSVRDDLEVAVARALPLWFTDLGFEVWLTELFG